MATVLKKQREKMTKAELAKDIEYQQKRIDKNNETLKKADKLDTGPGSLGAAMKEFGAMGNKNLQESKDEATKIRGMNSRSQYEHERKAGDPNALKLSFEEWKKL